MAQPTASDLERHLLALDADAFVDFVAALWAESGWTVERAGPVVEASRPGETRRLLVLPPRRAFPRLRRAPSVDLPIDAVVSPYRGTDRSGLPRGVPDAPAVDAEGLRDRLLYAVEDAPRERLFLDHLGTSADGVASSGVTPLPPIRAPSARPAAVAGAGALLVVVGLVLLLAATGAFSPGTSSAGTVNASVPTTAGAYATAESPVYDVHPNCERGPGEVVAISSAAVRGPRLGNGLVVIGRFWNPRHVRNAPTGVWNEMMRNDARSPYYRSTTVRFEDPMIEGDAATVRAVATIDGTETPYEFRLSKRSRSPLQGCWVIDGFGPV